MAKPSPSSGGKKDPGDELMVMVGGTALILAVVLGTIWLVGSERIIRATTPWLFVLAKPYGWLGVDAGQAVLGRLAAQADWLMRNSSAAGAAQFFPFLTACMRPVAASAATVMAAVLLWVAFVRKVPRLKRNLSNNPQQLVQILSKRFPGVIPVMHLGDKLIQDKLWQWRRQTWPEDVFLRYRIDGQPMSRRDKLDEAVMRSYFLGSARSITVGGHKVASAAGDAPRAYSHMLGRHLVDIAHDARGAAAGVGKLAFADRMSPEGKVIYALLCAHAFGDKADYWRAMRQLNESCLGHPLGLPNLTVAQWCYDKYRLNETARALFSVHHWEYSFLYALFFLAKRQGKVTHRDWIWLKPLNRVMFYCLNTTLRKAPPVEAATCWSQFGYERQVARLGRLPLTQQGAPMIMTLPAERALQAEFAHYMRAQDSDEDAWWKDRSVWLRSASAIANYGAASPVVPTPPPDSPFDLQQRALEEEAQGGRDRMVADGIEEISN